MDNIVARNFVFFTPASRSSAIGRMTALVVREMLLQGHSVTIVRTETEDLLATESHDFGVKVLAWSDEKKVRAVLGQAHLVIYAMGNNFEFHKGGLHWLELFPGLVCLHDIFVGHLFWGWAEARRDKAQRILRAWYGAEIAQRFFQAPDGETFIDVNLNSAPLTEWVCAQALGVITHSSWGCDRILKSCAGPVRVVPLAYDAPALPRQATNATAGDLILLTVGHVNPNKRAEQIIRAIGDDAFLKKKLQYNVVGRIQEDTRNRLQALATSLGVKASFAGEVDSASLASAIDQCSIVSCLRWPSLEAASASAIEAMLYGKPVLVTDVGFYSEIPDECALKVDPANEMAELKAALLRLTLDDGLRTKLANSAKKWATKTFSAEIYASEIVEMSEDVAVASPVLLAVHGLSETLGKWSSGNYGLADVDISRLSIFGAD